MLSTIKIHVDEQNQPVIKISYKHSDDLRDLMIKRFLETIGGGIRVGFVYTSNGDDAILYPIPEKQIESSI